MLELKLERLHYLFIEMGRALIAYSGGIDSTLVAKIAYDALGDRALAVTAKSPSLLPEELADASSKQSRSVLPIRLSKLTKWTIPIMHLIQSIDAIFARVNFTIRSSHWD